jgi:hypothetical protein
VDELSVPRWWKVTAALLDGYVMWAVCLVVGLGVGLLTRSGLIGVAGGVAIGYVTPHIFWLFVRHSARRRGFEVGWPPRHWM